MASDQKVHWNAVYSENESFFGEPRSHFGVKCSDTLANNGAKMIVELGSGQGRDTKLFLDKGFTMIIVDYSDAACAQMRHSFGDRIVVVQADLRNGLDLPPSSIDACYSHMLLTMDFTDDELKRLIADVRKSLVPGGYMMYSVRNINDPDFGKGENLHDSVWENDGFAVRFYSQDDIRNFADGFDLERVIEFTEGRKALYGVTMKKTD